MAYTTINDSSKHFNTILWTGNGSTQSISGIGFQPDWIWIKQRNGAEWHNLIDSFRGGTKVLYSNETNAEATSSNLITSFDSDGFSLGTANEVNGNTNTFASWNWLAGGTASSNTNGSITSSVSANATAGFSIVSWTGDGSDATIGHGLSSAPKLIIHKHRSGTVQWNVYADIPSAGTGGYLRIDNNNDWTSNSGFFGTAPTASVFSPGSHSYMSGSGNDNIAYCFANVNGYQRIGYYEGNGSSDGPFVNVGFKPAFILIKGTSTTRNWNVIDNKRLGYNSDNDRQYPNNNIADNTADPIDIFSNGFKCIGTQTDTNSSGVEYIYYAIAENPFVTSTGTPATAR